MATPTFNYTAATALTPANFVFVDPPHAYASLFPLQPIYSAVGYGLSYMALTRVEIPQAPRGGVADTSGGGLSSSGNASASMILWRSRWRPKRGQLWPRTR